VLVVLLASLVSVACVSRYEDELEATARRDLGCDEINTKLIGSSSRPYRSADYVVEGCGQISYYRCRRGDGIGGEYVCTMAATRELRSN
jgi:hypothetical protein